jgi:hypothetical protein
MEFILIIYAEVNKHDYQRDFFVVEKLLALPVFPSAEL